MNAPTAPAAAVAESPRRWLAAIWPGGWGWPAGVLAAGLLVSAGAAFALWRQVHNEFELNFQHDSAQLKARVEQRFLLPLYGLRGAAGAYASSGRTGDALIEAYVPRRDLPREFPGVLGFGFVQRVARGDVPELVRRQRAGDDRHFALRELDDHSHGELYVQTAIEPAGRNAKALGLDLGSDPVRRRAIEHAIDEGVPTLSSTLHLVQDEKHEPGFQLLLPLYRIGADPSTAAQRRVALVGLLVAPILARELLQDVGGSAAQRLHFNLLDEHAAGGTVVVFDSAASQGQATFGAAHASHPDALNAASVMDVAVPGGQLRLQVHSNVPRHAWAELGLPSLVFLFGALGAFAVAALLNSQRHMRGRAEALAHSMSADLSRLALVVRETANAVVITDAQRRITWVNAGFERLTGYTLAESLGRSPGELLQCEGTDPAVVHRMRSLLNAGEPVHCEVLNRAKDGTLYFVSLDMQATRDAHGQVNGFISIEADVTERRNAEAELRASTALLDQTGRIAGVGGWSYELSTECVSWTDESCRILGLPSGTRSSVDHCFAACSAEVRSRLSTAMAQSLAGGEGWDMEIEVARRDGQTVWVRLAAETEFADSGPVRVVGALQDITARRALQAEAQQSEALLRGAIETIDEAFVLFSPDDRLVFCNDKFRQLYPKAADVIVPGVRFEDIIRTGAARGQCQDAVGRIEEWVAERMAQHLAGNTTMVQRLADGRSMRVLERRMPDGHIVSFRIDITDLVRATEAAEQASVAKSAFIADVSHELRTPLQSVIGFSELGIHFAHDQPQFRPMFADIHAGGTRMLALVNDLLDVSKYTGEMGSLTLARGDLTALAAEVVQELHPLVAQRALQLTGLAGAAPLWAPLNALRMQQVLRNVLANAIRFAPVGSTIALDFIDHGPRGVAVTVRDHGPGIPADELLSVFEPFTQSSRTRDGSGGTGLGLAICRKIMASHGGRIAAHLPEGGGTLVRIQLPPAGLDTVAPALASVSVSASVSVGTAPLSAENRNQASPNTAALMI